VEIPAQLSREVNAITNSLYRLRVAPLIAAFGLFVASVGVVVGALNVFK
jgi:hypothetical protein